MMPVHICVIRYTSQFQWQILR